MGWPREAEQLSRDEPERRKRTLAPDPKPQEVRAGSPRAAVRRKGSDRPTAASPPPGGPPPEPRGLPGPGTLGFLREEDEGQGAAEGRQRARLLPREPTREESGGHPTDALETRAALPSRRDAAALSQPRAPRPGKALARSPGAAGRPPPAFWSPSPRPPEGPTRPPRGHAHTAQLRRTRTDPATLALASRVARQHPGPREGPLGEPRGPALGGAGACRHSRGDWPRGAPPQPQPLACAPPLSSPRPRLPLSPASLLSPPCLSPCPRPGPRLRAASALPRGLRTSERWDAKELRRTA
ncbi:proline-rich protein 2-like [Manis pentadactyla]|uniref:proline-rich protein 2-like n=1 Tax=Manis pentadactyla TaxID=143292 RepID=UPI00255C9917|nr:proline-rich protein 2-like [Manis pentadactyla]